MKPHRCANCRRKFKTRARGRPPIYCSPSCRQRAYEERRAANQIPLRLLRSDIDQVRNRDAIKRAVVDVLRELGVIPRPIKPKPARLRLVKEEPE